MKYEEKRLSRKTGAQMLQYFHKPPVFFAEALLSCSFHVQTQRFYCVGSV